MEKDRKWVRNQKWRAKKCRGDKENEEKKENWGAVSGREKRMEEQQKIGKKKGREEGKKM